MYLHIRYRFNTLLVPLYLHIRYRFNTPSFPCVYILGTVFNTPSFPCIYIFGTVFNLLFPFIYIFGTVLTHLVPLYLHIRYCFNTLLVPLYLHIRYRFNAPSFPCIYILGNVFKTPSFSCADDVVILRLYRRSNNVMEKGHNSAKEKSIKQTVFRNKSRLISYNMKITDKPWIHTNKVVWFHGIWLARVRMSGCLTGDTCWRPVGLCSLSIETKAVGWRGGGEGCVGAALFIYLFIYLSVFAGMKLTSIFGLCRFICSSRLSFCLRVPKVREAGRRWEVFELIWVIFWNSVI